MFSTPKPNNIEDWECVYETSKEYDAQLAKNYLESRDIEVSILSKRDSSFEVNVGDMALIYVYVPNDYVEDAKKAIEEWQNAESVDDEESE
jgi:beta-galactosidase beta subunit